MARAPTQVDGVSTRRNAHFRVISVRQIVRLTYFDSVDEPLPSSYRALGNIVVGFCTNRRLHSVDADQWEALQENPQLVAADKRSEL